MTPPSDQSNNGDDGDRDEFGAPRPPQPGQPPADGQGAPVSQPPIQQPPYTAPPVQQPPYAQDDSAGDASGWTQFGAPLPGPGGAAPTPPQQPPIAQPPISQPPIAQPPMGSPFSTPAMDPAPGGVPGPGEPGYVPGADFGDDFGAPADPAAPSGIPGPGEPGWVPGGMPEEAAPAPSGAPGPGEPGWVPGGVPEEAPADAGGAPGPGEPGWVPGGVPEDAPTAEAPADPAGTPGPGEPGWVPGGTPDVAPEIEATADQAGAPGPGEPGWVPGGGVEDTPDPAMPQTAPPQEAQPLSQPPLSQPPLSQPPLSQPPVSEPVAPPPVVDDADKTQIAIPQPAAAAPPADPVPTAAPQDVPPDVTQAEPTPEATAAAAAAAATATTAAAPAQPAPAPRKPRKGDGPTLDIGTVINNNYRIDQVLKAGGMGEVYRGAEVGTGDPVAIKVILPELAEDEKVGQMFKREARTLRQLQDEAIVRYYNYVHDPDLDAYCLVMAFISGVPLSDHTAANGPIDVEDGKILLRRLAKGLEKAHDLDVIHRDLSPDNVMLPHDKVAEAVLIDFGIAKSNVEKEQTLAGQFAGKFRYVSPEQLGHFGGEIGPQSDIYSLALLLVAALVGKPLEMGASIVEAVQSRQSIPNLDDVPQDLRPILMHMLEPNPEHRPQTMGDIIRLMDMPEQIPLNYRQGLPLPNTAQASTTMTTGLPYRPPTNQVSGLQLAPTTATTGATQTPTELPKRRRAGGGMGIALILAMAVIGGGGYYGYSEGWFDAPEAPAPEPEEVAEAPVRLENTREGFLGAFNSGGCTYATRITSGINTGMIAGMASVPGTFTGLPDAYEEKFGARPAIVDQQVSESQCAALTLAKGLQGTDMEPIALQLSTTLSETGMVVDGTLTDPDDRSLWLVLVGTNGQIFNLTSRLSDPIGDERTFRFNLNPLPQGAAGAPQLVLAVGSEEPLVRASVARDGTPAADLLPLIQREIDNNAGRAVSALGHVLQEPFVPPIPDIEEELNDDVDDDDDGDGND